MAAYTQLYKKDANALAADYGLPKVTAVRPIRDGSVNTHYALETVRGKFVVKIDEVKSELEVKRELDLLLFLRKHGFPCSVPLADRRGRHCRDWGGKLLSVYAHRRARGGGRRSDGEPAREHRSRSRRPPPDQQGLQEGRRESLQLRGGRRDLRRGPRPAAALLQEDHPHARRRGRVPAELPRGQAAEGHHPRRPASPTTCCFKGEKVVGILDFEAAVPRQVHLRSRDRRERALLRPRALRPEALRGADRRATSRCAPCRSPSGTPSRTSCASRRCASR